jgi:hypothetical protein
MLVTTSLCRIQIKMAKPNFTGNSLTAKDKIVAFEYAMMCFIEWSIEQNHYIDFNEFSERNDFSRDKSILTVFFLCIANGTRDGMFQYVFNKFKADVLGHIELDIKETIDQNNGELTNIILHNSRIRLKDNFLRENGLLKKIDKAKLLELYELGNIIENEGEESNGDTISNTHDLIDHSIKVLKSRNKDFVNFELSTLSSYSRMHISWQVHNLLSISPIDTKMMINEKSMYAFDAKERIFV